MEFYQPNRPVVNDSGLSGGVSYNFNGQIAAGGVSYKGVYPSPNPLTQSPGQTVTLQVCVNGVAKQIDVYAAGLPY